MTVTLALPPVYAAAVVNGLVGVAVLNPVPCPACRPHGTYSPLRIAACKSCRGSGTVAPPVEPGQRLPIAATRDEPEATGCFGVIGIESNWGPRTWTAHAYERAYRLHPGHVVGSAVATTPALPIVDSHGLRDDVPSESPCIEVQGDRIIYLEPANRGLRTGWDLSAALPWLPSDLVGKWAVLVGDPATTEQRCPTCWGSGDWETVDLITGEVIDADLRMECERCNGDGTCPPVPLPDGFDPEPYTLTEQEMT